MNVPIVLIVFNRPEKALRMFRSIARVKPTRLFVIADGPRRYNEDDIEKCAATRAIFDNIDWDCKLTKNYSKVNLGCGIRISTGITWVFEQVDRAIIIEDDCLPHPTFFRFCEELLEKYESDERIMHIAGRKACAKLPETNYDYYFSHELNCWGWATWARAWKHFDMGIRTWSRLRNTPWLQEFIGHRKMVHFVNDLFDRAYASRRQPTYWGPQWTYSVWSQNGLSIRPTINLVKYLGFEDHRGNGFWARPQDYDFPVEAMRFPMEHPLSIKRNTEADLVSYDAFFVSRFKGLLGYHLTTDGIRDIIRRFYHAFARRLRYGLRTNRIS